MKNTLRALLFIFLLLLAPLALAQDAPAPTTQTPAAGAGTVEDLAPSPPPVSAPPAPAGQSQGALTATGLPSYGLDMLWALGAFILVMVLLYLTLRALSRLSRFKGAKGRQSVFELRGIQPLDNRKYLAAVEVEGRIIVVGVTPDRITPVAHWFIDDEDDQTALNFDKVSLGPDPGPRLDIKLPEEDNSPLDISVAGFDRDHRK